MFKWFKKKKNKKNWEDITLSQFYQISDILEVDDDYTENNLIEVIYGVDVSNLKVTELDNYDISFLSKPIKNRNVKLKERYTINNREYDSNINLTEVRTNQFIDFTSYVRSDKLEYEKLLSVFFIPKGHKYNDGYDLREVQEDLLQLDIVTIQSLGFFMIKQYQLFAVIFQRYLEKLGEKREELKEMSKIIKTLVSSQS